MHLHAYRGQSFGNAIGDPAAGFTCVLADYGLGPGLRADEVMPQGTANQVRALFGQGEFACYSADTVGSE